MKVVRLLAPASWALLLILLSTLNSQLSTALAQGTAFTYQGRLNDGTNPAGGNYDLRFTIYDSVSAGSLVAGPLTNSAMGVSNGLFTATLDFGPEVFPGANRFLEIAVRTNGAGVFATLSPRQPLTPAPYAITAGNVVSNGLSAGTYGSAVTFNNSANNFSGTFNGNGGGLTNLNAATLGGLASSNFWTTGGNSNTIAGANYLGTADNQPLEFHVGGFRALRLEPNTNGAPNVIGGSPLNYVSNSVVGATIGGGGFVYYYGPTSFSNSVTGDFGTVGGGYQNSADFAATVGGGGENSAVNYSTVAGGLHNYATGAASVVGGGRENSSTNDYTTVSGGFQNNAAGQYATVGGGNLNVASGAYAAIGGGLINHNSGFAATVGGGFRNYATGQEAFIGGGGLNPFSLGNVASGLAAAIVGGSGNLVTNDLAIIGGGGLNTNLGYAAVLGGGYSNYVSGLEATIGGGAGNRATNSYATVGGGYANLAGGGSIAGYATVSGGYQNSASGAYSSVGGGSGNTVGGNFATAGGGLANIASGTGATVPGGVGNTASGPSSFAAGTEAVAVHDGAFVWGDDSTVTTIASVANNSVTFRAAGGYRLFSNAGLSSGVSLAPNTSAWSTVSDRNAKKNFAPVDAKSILEKLARIPIEQWNYKAEKDGDTPNIGPMAQDFKAAFYAGRDDKSISTLEFDGVELAAIQGLNEKVEVRTAKSEGEIQKLKTENAELKRQNATLEQRLEALETIVRQKKSL